MSQEYIWTKHAQSKMRFYRLSEQRVRRVLNSPKRTEEGIAPNTAAMMQPALIKTKDGKQTWSQEIWVMVQRTRINADSNADKRRYIRVNPRKYPRKSASVKIISAWRYPGRTKPGEPLPEEILREIKLIT